MIVGRCDIFRCRRRRSRSRHTSSLHHRSHRVCSLHHHRRTRSLCRALVLRAPSATALVAASSLLSGGSSSSLLITVSSVENQRIRSTRTLTVANQLLLLQRTEFLNSKVLRELNHPIVYSLSPGTSVTPALAKDVSELVNMYRITRDDWDNWADINSHFDLLLLAQLSEFVNDALFLSISCKQPSQPPPLILSITIINGATPKRAVCLDGTLPVYHFHPGSGSGANSWLNDLEVMAILADFILVYLPAPTIFFRPPPAINAGPIAKFFHNCPNNAFQVALSGTSYSLLQRLLNH
ncbi:hypothetical protein S83_001175 [Arachis hypogaea]